MHRDISSGNLLVRPVFCCNEEAGTFYVEWVGLLTDWEVSKPIAKGKVKERARQAERTVSHVLELCVLMAMLTHSDIGNVPVYVGCASHGNVQHNQRG